MAMENLILISTVIGVTVLLCICGNDSVTDGMLKFFKSDIYNATVTEHSAVGTVITQMNVLGLSESGSVTFKLLNGSFPVTLDRHRKIRVKDQVLFDREKYPDGINLTVEALVWNLSVYTTITVLITLEDVNDNSPTFICTYPFTVQNTSINAYIGQVAALEWDEGPNANVTYGFVDFAFTFSDCQGNREGQPFPFRVESTGKIFVSSPTINCMKYDSIVRGCDNPVVGDRGYINGGYDNGVSFFNGITCYDHLNLQAAGDAVPVASDENKPSAVVFVHM